jgi:hypothetical protein
MFVVDTRRDDGSQKGVMVPRESLQELSIYAMPDKTLLEE